MSPGVATILLFVSVVVLLVMGLPLSFVLSGVGVIFVYFIWGPTGFGVVGIKWVNAMREFIWIAVPLFVFMGIILEKSGIINDLYSAMYGWFGPLSGGLAAGTVIICTIMAAMTGVSAAATVTMSVIALPEMLKHKYDKSLALGCIAAGGALGVLIPPSVMMILWGVIAGVSVGKLFMGGIFPGLLLCFLFCLYILIRSFLQKDFAPALSKSERVPLITKLQSTRSLILPISLIIIVLGSIFLGIATPSEAAAFGAAGSLFCAGINRKLSLATLKRALFQTMKLTGMVMWIVLGASVFLSVYAAAGTQQLIFDLFSELPGGRWAVFALIQLSFFFLGCFLDPSGIIMITTPIYVPVIKSLGFDPLWFGVLFVVNMEMSYLTPPFGYNLFYIKSVVPKGITMGDIYRSVVPFITLQALGLVLVILFPQIVIWLPNQMLKS